MEQVDGEGVVSWRVCAYVEHKRVRRSGKLEDDLGRTGNSKVSQKQM